MENLYFFLGAVNSAWLIAIFVLAWSNKTDLLKMIGMLYFILAIPAFYCLYLAATENRSIRYSIFLLIFLAYLALEWLYDWFLKVPWRNNWKLMTPYLVMYYAMNYGFIVMPWKRSMARGLIMLCLFIVQIVANIYSHHPRTVAENHNV